MLPIAHLKHEMAGRVRIQVPEKRRDPGYFSRVKGKLVELDGVLELESNHVTGSILIRHRTNFETIRRFGEENALFVMAPPPDTGKLLTRRISEQIEIVDDRLIETTSGNIDLNSVLLAGLAVGATVQLLRNRVMPPAFTLLWYAMAMVGPNATEPVVTSNIRLCVAIS